MDAEMYVSPDGQARMRVTTPETATRMRARGWKPETKPAKTDAPKTTPKSKPEQS
jgi:hypothetical protein